MPSNENKPRRLAPIWRAIVEVGFISNPAQARLLATNSFQEREAQALFDAIAEVFGR